MRFGTGFSLDYVFISHLHADHYLGIIGLLRTLALQGRNETLHLYGPEGSSATLAAAVGLGGNRLSYAVDIQELAHGDSVDWEDFSVKALSVRHGVPALGYALREHPRPGRFDIEKAQALGIPDGPLFGRLHRGEAIEWESRRVEPEEVVGAPRPGRLVVYSGDTRPSDNIVEGAEGADLLIHDCTFGDEGSDRAKETHHSTAREAAEVAVRARVKRLYLTHLSARYSANVTPVETEAREVFPGAEVAYDGLNLEIEYAREGEADG